jgi:hypothetical protein
MAMRVYTIHLPPPFTVREGEPEVVREGFNWFALVFGPLWALVKGMWVPAILILVAGLLIGFGAGLAGLNELARSVLGLAFAVFVGAEANDWHRRHLDRKGWREAATVAASSRELALRRYADLAALGAAGRGAPA